MLHIENVKFQGFIVYNLKYFLLVIKIIFFCFRWVTTGWIVRVIETCMTFIRKLYILYDLFYLIQAQKFKLVTDDFRIPQSTYTLQSHLHIQIRSVSRLISNIIHIHQQHQLFILYKMACRKSKLTRKMMV